MRRFIVFLLLAAVIAGAVYYFYPTERSAEQLAQQEPEPALPIPELAPVGATMLDGLGEHGMEITTDHPEVQQWFDQALALTYGFNHEAAERSYLKAAEIDPECAMCWWGASLVLGPNINAGMNPDNNATAWERLQAARALAAGASEREQAYIDALATRYSEDPPADRRPLDEAYAEAMGELARQYSDDLDAATLYAESMMNLQPWNFWDDDGAPRGNTSEILAVLESVMERNPDHPGALHMYIHAVEASDEPERGVTAADRLRSLVPGAGHLVHMPAHIYARVGRWNDAVEVNQLAIEADDEFLAICRPPPGVYPLGYVPHNHHFLWFAASMQGSSAIALDAAAETGTRSASDPDLLRAPGMEWLQNFASTSLHAQVRFGRWDDIVDTPRPAEDLPFKTAIWHYAQGVAAVRQGRMEQAEENYAALAEAADDPVFTEILWFDRYPLRGSVVIAERVLAAELAAAQDDHEAAIAALKEAVALEDELPYDEPPGWPAPVRQSLGAVLLDAGQPSEAEAVYRAELRRNPENGWSLFGLEQALRAQDDTEEADQVAERFEQAWANADVELTASRF